MPVATPSDLRAWLRIPAADWSADDAAAAALLLELAQGVIEEEAGQTLDSSEDTVILDGPTHNDGQHHAAGGSVRLVLPRWPVTAVDSVELLNRDGSVSSTLMHGADYTWSQAGILTRIGGCWPTGDQVVRLTYTAGFVTWPAGLRRIALRLAAQAWTNPANLTQEVLGDHSRSFAAESLGMELSQTDRRVISAYRARTTS